MSVDTYQGPVEGTGLGVTLMHEHVFVMAPELALNYPRYAGWDEDAAIDAAVDRLAALYDAGVGTIVDATILGLGRMPGVVARVAARSPVRIVAATGVYVMADLPLYLKLRGPGALFDEPEPLVDLFITDLTEGLCGTAGVRAGVIKCTTDRAGMTPDVERGVRAAARAHLATGAPIITHTNAWKRTGLDQQRVLAEEGVDLSRVVIGHSGDTDDIDYLVRLLEGGSYLGMDRFGLDWYLPTDDRVAVIAGLCRDGWASRLVLSHDAACHNDAFRREAMGRAAPDHHHRFLTADVVPRLRTAGVSAGDLDRMLVENPRRILDYRKEPA